MYLFLYPGNVKASCFGTLHFPAYAGLHHGFHVCQTQYIALISVQGEKTNTPLLTVLLCACALSLLVVPGTLLVEIAVVTISIV